MFKKLVKNSTTFLILTGLYLAYARGFKLLQKLVGYEPPALITRELLTARLSATAKEKIELAKNAFGKGHWSADPELPISYYYVDRGYWIYSKRLEKLDGGKRIRLRPFAMIYKSKDSDKIQTAVADEATLDLDQPLGVSRKPGESSGHVVHARLDGNVRLRDNKGTPDIIEDDLRIGDPIPYLEFDDHKLRISSTKRVVVLDGKDHRVEGTGFSIDLRQNDAPPPRPGMPAPSSSGSGSGFSGAKTIILDKDVVVWIRDVGKSGVLPGQSRDPGAGETPIRVRSDGPMRIDLPRPKPAGPPIVGPPEPPEPTVVRFDRNVEVQRGSTAIDQLNGDSLLMLFNPSKADPTGSIVGDLDLRWAKASGHAVWLQSQAQDMIIRSNELIYDRPGAKKPDKIYLAGAPKSRIWVQKTERDPRGRITAIHSVRTFDATIFDDGKPGGPQSIVARGPGILETRPARDREIERTATWGEELVMTPFVLNGQTLKRLQLKGEPKIDDVAQGSLEAKGTIIAFLEPAESADPEPAAPAGSKGSGQGSVVAKAATEKPAAAKPAGPTAGAPAPAQDAQAGTAAGFRIVRLEAYDNVHMQGSGRDFSATERLITDFTKPPKPTAAATAPAAAQTVAQAPGRGDAAKESAKAEAPKTKPDETPPPPPPPPKVTAIARKIDARILQQTGAASNGTIETARLYGAVKVHQDPKPNEAKGNDVAGEVIELASQGDGLMKFHVRRSDPRVKPRAEDPELPPASIDTSDDRHLEGDVIIVDQKRNELFVPTPGKLIMVTKNDILADPDQAPAAPLSAPRPAPAPRSAAGKKDLSLLEQGSPTHDRIMPVSFQTETKPAGSDRPKIVTVTWYQGMTFWGKPELEGGGQGSARALFRGAVVAKSEDSDILTEEMEVDFDQEVSFARTDIMGSGSAPSTAAGPAGAPAPSGNPNPDILQVRCRGTSALSTRNYSDDRAYLKNRTLLNGDYIIYDKPSGHFWVEGRGIARIYDRGKSSGSSSRSTNRNERTASGPAAARRSGSRGPANRTPAPAQPSANPRSGRPASDRRVRPTALAADDDLDKTPEVPPLILTRIQFEKGMEGRLGGGPRKPGDDVSRQADFFEQVELLRAVVEDENRDLDPDRAPADALRMSSDVLEIQSIPGRPISPTAKADDVTYAIAVGNAIAGQWNQVIRAARITHSSATDLIYCYPSPGPGGEVILQKRSAMNLEPSLVRGKILKLNLKTRETEWADPSGIRLFEEEGGRLSAPSPTLKKPNPPKNRLRRLTPGDKERSSFNPT